MHNLTPAELQARAKKAKLTAAHMRDLYTEAADIVLPNRLAFDDELSGQRRVEPFVTTSFGQDQAHRFARRAQDLLFPTGDDWVEFCDKDGEPDEALSELRDEVIREMRASNFLAVIGGTLLDLSIGTCGMSVEPVAYGNSCLRFRGLPLDNLYLLCGMPGRVGGVFREFKATREAMAEMYPRLRMDGMMSGSDSQKRTYTECHVEVVDEKGVRYQYALLDGGEVVDEQMFKTPRFAVARWSVATEEVFGRGPAILALEDLRQLNHLVGTMNEAAEYAINPIFAVSAMMNFEPDKLRLEPGSFLPLDNVDGIRPLNSDSRVYDGLQLVERLQGDIRKAFLDSVRDRNDPVVTATQAHQEFLDFVAGGVAQLTRFHDELVRPMIRSAAEIVMAKKPDDYEGVDMDEVQIIPRNRLTKISDVNMANSLVQFVIGSGEHGAMLFDIEEIMRDHFLKLGGDPNHLNSEEEVSKMKQAREMQMAAAAAGAGMGMTPGDTSPSADALPPEVSSVIAGAISGGEGGGV